MEGLIEGRVVHYVIEDGRNKGEHRAAIVVKNLGQNNGCANLTVFYDWTNDGEGYGSGLAWETSRLFDDTEKSPGTWHWPERA